MPDSSHSLLPRVARIEQRVVESDDVFSVSLNIHDTDMEPGQFNMLTVFGAGEIPISISAIPEAMSEAVSGKKGEVIHTIRNVGGVSHALSELSVGDTIGVRGPFGRGWPIDKASNKNLLLVAGGIGLVPLRPVLHHCLQHNEDFSDIVLLYGARSPQDILFKDELSAWQQREHWHIELSVDRGDAQWTGNVGVITPFIARQQLDFENTIAMVCGPEIMMRFACSELLACGLSEDAIFVSMERNMKCAVGHCGHCQFGPHFICKHGPVLSLAELRPWFGRTEV